MEYSTRWLEADNYADSDDEDEDDDDSDDDDNDSNDDDDDVSDDDDGSDDDNDNDVSDDDVHMNLISILSLSLYREPDSVTQSALNPSTIKSM